MNRAENTDIQNRSIAILENRKELSLTGIENIVSFDENFVVLDGSDSTITVEGEGLQILKMDTDSGEISISGKINGLFYSDKNRGAKRIGGFFKGFKKQ